MQLVTQLNRQLVIQIALQQNNITTEPMMLHDAPSA